MSTDPIEEIIRSLYRTGWTFQSLHLKAKNRGWTASARHGLTNTECRGTGPDHRSALSDLLKQVTSQTTLSVPTSAPRGLERPTILTAKERLALPTRIKPTKEEHPSAKKASKKRKAPSALTTPELIRAYDAANLATGSKPPQRTVIRIEPSRARPIAQSRIWKAPDRPKGRSRSDIANQLGVSRRKVDEAAGKLGIVTDPVSDDDARRLIVELQ